MNININSWTLDKVYIIEIWKPANWFGVGIGRQISLQHVDFEVTADYPCTDVQMTLGG